MFGMHRLWHRSGRGGFARACGWGCGAVLTIAPLVSSGCHSRRPTTEAEARERAHDAAEFVLDSVDATPVQQAKIDEILDKMVPDLWALRSEREALFKDLHLALGAKTIDPAQVEAVRQRALELADRMSTRVTQALVEAASTLDEAQRAKLLRQAARFHRG